MMGHAKGAMYQHFEYLLSPFQCLPVGYGTELVYLCMDLIKNGVASVQIGILVHGSPSAIPTHSYLSHLG